MAGRECSEMWSRVPILVILGATGTGKSKLALQLAGKFNGEIISADSMQVYKGLDIITNKVTSEEQNMVPHHLLDFLNPFERYTVVDFRDTSIPIIKKISEAKKIPIIVGGTHYYIESLLWKVLVEDIGTMNIDYQIPNEHLSSELCTLMKFIELTIDKCHQEIPEDDCISCEKKDFMKNQIELENLFQPLKEKIEKEFPSWNENEEKEKEEKELKPKIKKLTKFTEELRYRVATFNGEQNRKLEPLLEQCLIQLRDIVKSQYTPLMTKLKLQEKKLLHLAENETNKTLHNKLKQIDPAMALCFHPNNTRKILRSIQVFAQRGKRHSEILNDQRNEEGGCQFGGPLRFPNSVMFWIDADKDILDKRLDARVDDMIKRGLLKELLDFHKEYNMKRIANMDSSKAYTQGIFQSIGFKEFHGYLTLTDEKRNSEEGEHLLQQGIEDLKNITRKYARKQRQWIRNRFLKSGNREVPPVYSLDATDLNKWDENVLNPAVAVVSRLLDPNWKGTVPEPLPKDETQPPNSTGEHYCTVCQRVFIGEVQWEAHLKSRKHSRVLKKRPAQETSQPSAGAAEEEQQEPDQKKKVHNLNEVVVIRDPES